MLKSERQHFILNRLKAKRKVLSTNLSKELLVSEDTIRRDLKELESKHLLHKVHGGALVIRSKTLSYDERRNIGIDKKIAIAKKAVSLITNGQVIIMSGSTTNLELAKILPSNINATVFTYSLPIAIELSHHPLIEVIFIGGKINKAAQVTVGIDVVNTITKIRADICFIGTSGLEINNGLTESSWDVKHIKKSMIQVSDYVVAMCVSNKLNIVDRHSVAPINQINAIITDLKSNNSIFKEYIDADVSIL